MPWIQPCRYLFPTFGKFGIGGRFRPVVAKFPFDFRSGVVVKPKVDTRKRLIQNRHAEKLRQRPSFAGGRWCCNHTPAPRKDGAGDMSPERFVKRELALVEF